MKRILMIVALMGTALLASDGFAQSKGKQAEPRQAVEGDEIWVVVNTIKADKREQFEKWVFEIFWPAGMKLPAKERAVFEQTRVLRPIKANADGTWTYIYLMDPLIPGAEYNISRLLKRMFDEAKAQEYGRMMFETYAKPQTSYDMKQGRSLNQ
ncbi:MAG: hypothetical protein HOP19_20705 [Acidobacteria bacterium]|nr:hypothetical protein [Acidobacteriota bacterium]